MAQPTHPIYATAGFDRLAHSLSGLPTCKHCQQPFRQWDGLVKHIQRNRCQVLRRLLPSAHSQPQVPTPPRRSDDVRSSSQEVPCSVPPSMSAGPLTFQDMQNPTTFQRDPSLRHARLQSLPRTLHLHQLQEINRFSYGRVSRQEYVLAGGLNCHRTNKSRSTFGITALFVFSGWRPPLASSHISPNSTLNGRLANRMLSSSSKAFVDTRSCRVDIVISLTLTRIVTGGNVMCCIFAHS